MFSGPLSLSNIDASRWQVFRRLPSWLNWRNPLGGFASPGAPRAAWRQGVCLKGELIIQTHEGQRESERAAPGASIPDQKCRMLGAPSHTILHGVVHASAHSRIILLTYISGEWSSRTAFPGGGFYLGFQFSLVNVLSLMAKQKHKK